MALPTLSVLTERKRLMNDGFPDFIAISSDTLLIINKHLEAVEWIIEGNDTDGIYLLANSEDDFLDAISFFKEKLLSGDNPKKYVDWGSL